MPIIDFPAEFDLDYYRKAYPELKFLIDEGLTAHYKKFAAERGHSACPYDLRENLQRLLQNEIDRRQLKVLEIGCGAFPFFVGGSVKYFEIVDAETLRADVLKEGRTPERVPEKIHFVSPTGDLGIVDEKFDIVFTSHVVEHTPDLIEHLQNVSRILNAGGLYILAVPDKRFCFDHFNTESTLAEVIDAFVNERKIPRLADVLASYCTGTHNSATLHWLGDHGEFGGDLTREKIFRAVEEYSVALERGEYINVHNWRFTPDSFGYIVNMLNKLNFIDLPLYRLCHTVWGRFEFIAMLEKK